MSSQAGQSKLRAYVARNDATQAEAVLTAAEIAAQQPKDPLILRLLLGIAAWIASLLLIGFIFSIFTSEGFGTLVTGIAILTGGIVMHYRIANPGPFIQQVTLAVVMSGHLMTLFGAIMTLDPEDPLIIGAVIQTALSGLSIRVFPRATYQTATLLLTIVLWTIVSLERQQPAIYHCLLLIQIVAFCAIVLWQSRRNSFAYTLAVALGASIFFLDWMQSSLWQQSLNAPLWPATLTLSMLTAAIGLRFIPPERHTHPLTLILLVTLCLLAFISTPGLLFAVAMLALGHGQRDAIFTLLGLAALPTFLILFYYSLQVSLLEKSGILLASGLFCLFVAWLASRRIAPGAKVEVSS